MSSEMEINILCVASIRDPSRYSSVISDKNGGKRASMIGTPLGIPPVPPDYKSDTLPPSSFASAIIYQRRVFST